METTSEMGWYVDPLGRHAHRYWSGTHWTEHVADGGKVGIDPLDSTATAPAATVPTAAPAPVPAPAAVSQSTASLPVPTGTPPTLRSGAAESPPATTAPVDSGSPKRSPLLIGGAIVGAAALVVVGIVVFTGGSDDGSPGSQANSRQTVMIDSALGGEFVSAHGARLDVPAGAVPSTDDAQPGTIAFSVDVVDDLGAVDHSNLPDGIAIAETVYEFEPTGMSFQAPVEIEIPLDPGVDPTSVGGLAYFDRSTQSWQQVNGTVDPATNTVRGSVMHFSPYTYWFHQNANGEERAALERERGGYISITNVATNYGWRDFPSTLFGYDPPKYPYTNTSYGVCIASWDLDDPSYESQMSWYGGADRPLTVEARVARGGRAGSGGTVDFWLPAGTYQLEEVWFPSEINWGADPLYLPLVGSAHRPIGSLRIDPGDRHEFVEEANVPFPNPDADWIVGRTDCVPQVSPLLGTGSVQVTLTWPEDNVDLDLYVIDPAGDVIYHGERESASGGRLDHDNRTVGGYPENIFWTGDAPAGEYRVEVNYFENSVVTDANARWTVSIVSDGERTSFNGTIRHKEQIEVTTFRVD